MDQQGIEERRVTWMPAFVTAVITLILLAVVFVVGAVVLVAGLVTLVIRLVRRRWDPWGWAGLGTLGGAAVYGLLTLLHAVF